MTAYAAFLRVYEPLAAFEGEQRRRWEAYAAAGDAPSTLTGPEQERAASCSSAAAAEGLGGCCSAR